MDPGPPVRVEPELPRRTGAGQLPLGRQPHRRRGGEGKFTRAQGFEPVAHPVIVIYFRVSV